VGCAVLPGGGVARSLLDVSDKLMVPLGHRNNGTATGRNGGLLGETRSGTRTQKEGDAGERGQNLSDPILRVDVTCRRCIVLVR